MQEAQVNFEARARSNEQQRQLVSQAKLRDLKVEIAENEEKTNQLENRLLQVTSSQPPASVAVSRGVNANTKVSVSVNASSKSDENDFQYLEEQKQRYLQRVSPLLHALGFRTLWA